MVDVTKEEGIETSIVTEDIESILHNLGICSLYTEY
jgi:hypothetical protein